MRRATPADAPAIAALTAAAYSKYIVRMGREPQPMRTDYVNNLKPLLDRFAPIPAVATQRHRRDLTPPRLGVHPRRNQVDPLLLCAFTAIFLI